MNALKVFLIFFIILMATGCSHLSDKQQYTGVLEGTNITVSSPISEKLIQLQVDEGHRVHRGQLLGFLDTTQLHLQKIKIMISKEEILLQQKNTQIKLSQLSDAYQHAQQKLERNQNLLEQNAIPDQRVKDMELEVSRLKKEIESVKISHLILGKKLVELNTQEKIVRNNLNKAILYSPIDGYIEKIYVDEGEYLAPMTPLMDIVNLETPWCYIYVAEPSLPSFRFGMPVTATIDGSSESFDGKVTFISKQAEFTPKEILTPENRTALVFAIKVELQNKNMILKSGMPVEIKIGQPQ